MTALIPVELNECLSRHELKDLLDTAEAERTPVEQFITEAIREKMVRRRQAREQTASEPGKAA